MTHTLSNIPTILNEMDNRAIKDIGGHHGIYLKIEAHRCAVNSRIFDPYGIVPF